MGQLEPSSMLPLGGLNRPLPNLPNETLSPFTLNDDRSDTLLNRSQTSFTAAISVPLLHVTSDHSILPTPAVTKSSSPPYLTLNISRSPLLSLLSHSPLLPSEESLKPPVPSPQLPLLDAQITASLVKPLAPLSFASDYQRRRLSLSANKHNKPSGATRGRSKAGSSAIVTTTATATTTVTPPTGSHDHSSSIHSNVLTLPASNQSLLSLPPQPPSTLSPKETISLLNFLEAMDKEVSYEFQRVSDAIKEAHTVADEYRQERETRRVRWTERKARERERRERDERETKGVDSEFWLS